MKVLSCFSGLGAFEKALKRQNIEYELVNYCEIDKYASKAYSLIHNVSEELNLGDITKVNEKELNDFDLMTWGFPCVDISIAGKQEGIIKGKTRSGLYYEGLRILQCKKPKYSIIENVKNLTGKKFKLQFKQILNDLEDMGYNNYWKVLNAKDYGIPQNRERVFIISIRKDIDDNKFEFPIGFDNGLRLKDLLEDEVDEKYYISQDKVDKLIEQLKEKNSTCAGTYNQKDGFKEREIGCTLDANYYKGLGCNQNRNAVLKVAIQINHMKLKFKVDDICSCIDAHYGKGLDNHAARTGIIQKKYNVYKIRKLTPLECLRLMGFNDEDYYILKQNKISNSQIYKMAGNSIVVNVLEEIFKKLFK